MDLKKTATAKEIAAYYCISTRTLQRRLKPYRKFFTFDKRKSIYMPDEINFIKKIFSDNERDK